MKKADLIIRGCPVFDGIKQTDNDFVAVKCNQIIGTGKGDVYKQYINPDTRIKDFPENYMIMPGIHDNHIHMVLAGMFEYYPGLGGAGSAEDVALKIGNYAKDKDIDKWIIGFGWCRHNWEDISHPTKELLDKYVPDHPVFLLDSELHGAWTNSKALAIAGITGDTQDPPFGEIVKDDDGEPTGFLNETALAMVGEYAFSRSDEEIKDLLRAYMNKANSLGITSVSDMTPYLGVDLSFPHVFHEMDEDGQLTVRVNAAGDLLSPLSDFLENRKKYNGNMYRLAYLKQFLDGVIANYTAMLLEDYSDNPGEKGGSLLDVDSVLPLVEEAHKNKIPVRFHSCGDGSARVAIDQYENAIKKHGANGTRHIIEHLELVDPKDIPRLGELDIVASIQPEHICSGIATFENNCYPARIGSQRVKYTWPFKSMEDTGAVLAAGSDAPVAGSNPFVGIYSAVTRLHNDGTPKGGWNPQERLSMGSILKAYTYGASWSECREEELGTIEDGKLADVIVVDRNLFDAEVDDVLKCEVMITVVDGKVVFQR